MIPMVAAIAEKLEYSSEFFAIIIYFMLRYIFSNLSFNLYKNEKRLVIISEYKF